MIPPVLGFLAVACGASTPTTDASLGVEVGPDAASVFGLDPESTLNTLGHDEVARLCQGISPLAAQVAADPVLSRASCILRIIQRHFTRLQTTLDECRRSLAACDDGTALTGQGWQVGALPSLLEAGLVCASSVPDIDPSCRAKVGEVDGCLKAGLLVLPVANQATCETIVSGEASRQVAQALGNVGVLSCQGYQSKCPAGFFGATADAGQ